jgi:hypothetical protein
MACHFHVPSNARKRARDRPAGGNVRKIIQLALIPVAVAAVACNGEKRSQTAMAEDLKRDLQLASATQTMRISPDEIAPQAQQELTLRPKRAPNGPKVVRTETPTVLASATPVEVAEIKTDIPEVQAMAAAPSESETPSADAPPMARPAPVPMPTTYPTAAEIPASAGGSGGVLGGIFGAVIRGGRAGDDHCDPRTDRGRGRAPDVYRMPGAAGPTIMGGMGGMARAGGMGAGRVMAGRPR